VRDQESEHLQDASDEEVTVDMRMLKKKNVSNQATRAIRQRMSGEHPMQKKKKKKEKEKKASPSGSRRSSPKEKSTAKTPIFMKPQPRVRRNPPTKQSSKRKKSKSRLFLNKTTRMWQRIYRILTLALSEHITKK
jgi:hypothetical protein